MHGCRSYDAHHEVALRVPSRTRGRILLVVLGPEALERRPGLQQCAVDGEVLFGEEPSAPGFRQHRLHEPGRDIVLHEPPPVLREGRGIEGGVIEVEVQEPLKEEVVLQPFTELALAADRIERHQKGRLEEVLWRDRRTPDDGVHRFEAGRQFPEDRLHQCFDAADRMVLRHLLVGRDGRKRCLPGCPATHLVHLRWVAPHSI